MCKKIAPLAFALAAFGSAAALAQELPPATPAAIAATPAAPPAWTLEQALQQALARHPSLAAARNGVEAAAGALDQAGMRPNPTLGLEVEDLRSKQRTTTLLLSQPFELGGKREARQTAAERGLASARAQAQAVAAQLRADVTEAFLSGLLAQERVRLAQASLDLAHDISRVAGQRVQAGKVSPVERTRAQVAEANIRLEWVQARGALATWRETLRMLMATDQPVLALDGDALAVPGVPDWQVLQARLDGAPALRLARLETQRLAALVDVELARRKPDITLSVGMQRVQQDGRNLAVIGVSVPLPLFDTNRGAITEALRRRDQAEDGERAAELRLRADVSIARQRLAVAAEEVATIRGQILPGAQAVLEAATTGFWLGKFGHLDVLDAQHTLLQAREQYLRSLGEAHRAAADLDRLLGDPTPQS